MNSRTGPQAAIYAIRNQRTGAVYVGSTRNIKQRWTMHRCNLRHKRHTTKALQAAWIEDGPDAFTLEILEALPLPIAAATLNAAEEAWFNRMRDDGTPLYSKWFMPRVEDRDGPRGQVLPLILHLLNLQYRALASDAVSFRPD